MNIIETLKRHFEIKAFIAILCLFATNYSFSQKVYIYLNDGTHYHYSITNVDSIVFIESDNVIPEAIDLGLSVKWASFNVGASEPGEYGGLYGWGDSSGEKKSTDYNDYPYYDAPFSICGTKYDIAREILGDGWRLPTTEEQEELCEKCTFKQTQIKLSTGRYVSGHLVTGPNGNSIFLPYSGHRVGSNIYDKGVVGHYWSGSQNHSHFHADNRSNAMYLSFGNGGRSWYNWTSRYYGMSIRPVKD